MTLSIPIRRTARPAARSVRVTAIALAVAVPLALVLLNLAMGQDANWDLRNYHWYNPYSFLNGRFFFDVVPAQTPSFYNPTLDVPFFLLGNAVPAPVAYSVLALVQSLNFVLLFALAHAVLRIDRPLVKVWAAAAIALVGVAGGGNLSQIGTTFHDNTVSLGVFGAMLLVVRQWDRITAGTASSALGTAFLAGLLAGTRDGAEAAFRDLLHRRVLRLRRRSGDAEAAAPAHPVLRCRASSRPSPCCPDIGCGFCGKPTAIPSTPTTTTSSNRRWAPSAITRICTTIPRRRWIA